MSNILWNPAANNPCLKELTIGPFPDVKSIFILLSYFFNVYSNFIIHCSPRVRRWSIHIFPLNRNTNFPAPSHACLLACPSHTTYFDHPTNIWWGLKIVKLIIQFSLTSCYFQRLSSFLTLIAYLRLETKTVWKTQSFSEVVFQSVYKPLP